MSEGLATSRLFRPWYGLLLALSVLLIFAPTVGTFFSQDDFPRLLRAQTTTPDRVLHQFLETKGRFYRPMVELYFTLLLKAFGLQSGAWQVVNLGILALNGWLLAQLCLRMGLSGGGAFAAGLFYCSHSALHALVMWPSAASSLLVVLFGLLSLRLTISAPRWHMRFAGAGSLALALAAKEVAVLIPIIACLALVAVQRRDGLVHQSKLRLGLYILLRTLPLLLVLAFYVVVRMAFHHMPAAEDEYAIGLGPHVARNLIHLLSFATGLLPGAGLLLGAPSSALYQLIFWGVMLVGTWRLHRRGDRLATLGLLWFAIGLAPTLFLSRHPMDAYYLDIALAGLACSVGAILQAVAAFLHGRLLRHGCQLALLAGYLVLNFLSVRFEISRSPIVGQARRAESVLDDVRSICPTLPHRATLLFIGVDNATRWAMGFGDLFRVMYNDPTLDVRFASAEDEAPSPPIAHGAIVAFRVEDGQIVHVPAWSSPFGSTPSGGKTPPP